MDGDSFIHLDEFDKLEKIGEGGFGKVFIIKNKNTEDIYAAKISYKEIGIETGNKNINIRREINIMSKLNHPSILKFIGFSPIDFKNRPRPVIVTEYFPNNSLFNMINSEKRSMSPHEWDKTSGMSYLHSHKIIHRDLKSMNIILDDDLFPKISDFGILKILHKNPESISYESGNDIKGTPNYISPEIWSNYSYTPSSDVYAYGMILYEIFSQKVPFEKVPYIQIIQKVSRGERHEFASTIEEPYKELIKQCWSQDPLKRPTFDRIIELLKNDRRFITDDIDEDEFKSYIKYIDESQITFDADQKKLIEKNYIQNFGEIEHQKESKKAISKNATFSKKVKPKNFYPIDLFHELDYNCQELVKEAEFDENKQFKLGTLLIEGTSNFPTNIEIGIKYLEASMNSKCIDSVIYLCNILMEGQLIQQDLKKAKKYCSKFLNLKDSQIYFLYAKITKKLNNLSESRKYFNKAAKQGNNEAMYKYAKMLFTGEGGKIDLKSSFEYFKISQRQGNTKSDTFLHIYAEMKEIEGFLKMSTKNQFIIISIIMKSDFSKHKMCIDFSQLEKLNENGLIESKELTNVFRIFSIVFIQLNYPSQLFQSLYNSITTLKQNSNGNIRVHLYIINDDQNEFNLANIIGPDDIINRITIESSMEEISDYAFCQFKSLTKIYLPLSLIKIGEHSFEGCISMKKIDIPLSVTEIGATAFFGCTSLQQITATDRIISILNNNGCFLKGISNFEEAIRLFKITAEAGNAKSIYNYALMLFNGRGVEVNVQESVKLIKKSADEGCVKAMNTYGHLLLEGQVVPPDNKAACKYLIKAARRGFAESLRTYGLMLRNGIGVETNAKKSIRLLKKAADKGDVQSMKIYGLDLLNGNGVEKNEEEACRYIKMSADKGCVESMTLYASIMINGTSVEKNEEESFRYFKMAADKGDLKSIHNCGFCLTKGIGTPINHEEATKCYKMAVDQGYVKSITNYGYNLFKGIGIEQNLEEDNRYYKMAADQGCTNGMLNYGMNLISGEGVKLNIEEGIKYIKMAADKGHIKSVNKYASLLKQGNGIPKNYEESIKYYKLGVDKDNDTSILNYASMLKKG